MNERLFEPTDLPSVIEVYTASIRSLAAPFYTPEQLAAWAPATPDVERWRQRLASLHTIVADCDGVLAGFASYRCDGYLDFLFTHPAFARRGIATRLYLRVEAALLSEGCPKVFTHASLAARPFFDRHGFQLDAEESVECRGVCLRRFAMHKELSHTEESATWATNRTLPEKQSAQLSPSPREERAGRGKGVRGSLCSLSCGLISKPSA